MLTHAEPADINSPEVAKTQAGGSGQGKDENVVNGHKEGDANPFAEYMWMENEEEYNRQVSVGKFMAQNATSPCAFMESKIQNSFASYS